MGVTNLAAERVRRRIVQHIEGYLDAMKDVLDDLDAMQYDAEEGSSEYVDGFHDALGSLKSRMDDHVAHARETLNRFKEKDNG